MRKLQTIGAFALSLNMMACAAPGKVTGGGQLFDDSGTRVANFGFAADSCNGDLTHPRGHFNYVSQVDDVKMNGDLTRAEKCVASGGTDIDPNCDTCASFRFGFDSYLVYYNYRSTNPATPGTGSGLLCTKDNGEGRGATPDDLEVFVFDGPYAGYDRIGTVKGNIMSHTCP